MDLDTDYLTITVESLNLSLHGCLYTQISEETGIYSYDSEVVNALAEMGYEWTTYFAGERTCDLKDTALFNDLSTDNMLITGPRKVIASNIEIDHVYGKYEVEFALTGYTGSNCRGPIVVLEVLGEAGGVQVLQKELFDEDFDSEGRCVCNLLYETNYVPKVMFAVSVQRDVSIIVDKISWKRKHQLFDCSYETKIYADGKIIMQTTMPDNRFSMLCFQITDAPEGRKMVEFGSANTHGRVSGDYIHNLDTGLYYVRLKGNASLADEWVRKLLFIERGSTIHYGYYLDEFLSDNIEIHDLILEKEK